MTIPNNLTHEEVGLLLIAVGSHMQDHDVAAEAVLDWSAYGDPEEAQEALAGAMVNAAVYTELTLERAHEVLGLTLEEAISYNEMLHNLKELERKIKEMEHPNAAQ